MIDPGWVKMEIICCPPSYVTYVNSRTFSMACWVVVHIMMNSPRCASLGRGPIWILYGPENPEWRRATNEKASTQREPVRHLESTTNGTCWSPDPNPPMPLVVNFSSFINYLVASCLIPDITPSSSNMTFDAEALRSLLKSLQV
jgi:hypothetical protein